MKPTKRKKPSELLKQQKETGLSYWDMIGYPLPEVTVTADYPNEDRVWDTVDNLDTRPQGAPEFINRLNNNDRRSVEYGPNGSQATFLIGNDGKYAFPLILDVNGSLHNYDRQYGDYWYRTPYENKDYIKFNTPGDARYFAEHYKDHWPLYFQGFAGGKKPKDDDTDDTDEESSWDKTRTVSRFLNPVGSTIDAALWGLNRLGIPAHFTNAARDVSNSVYNFVPTALGSVYNYLTSDKGILESIKAADTNPGLVQSAFMVHPMLNTAENYTLAQLAAMYDLQRRSGNRGFITGDAYRDVNNGSYAADVSLSDLVDPYKTIEWSIGGAGTDGSATTDRFAYDLKDTYGTYPLSFLYGNGTPVLALRILNGIIGSKGYDDGTNSALSIETNVDLEAQKIAAEAEANGIKILGPLERRAVGNTKQYSFVKHPRKGYTYNKTIKKRK